MATSGSLKSWTVPSGYLTLNNQSYSGAHYLWSWEAASKDGITVITWNLQGLGRNSSPKWLQNTCDVTVSMIKGTTTASKLYSLSWENSDPDDTDDGTNCSFNSDQVTSYRAKGKQFTINHDINGEAEFHVKIATRIYINKADPYITEYTFTLDKSKPETFTVNYNANGYELSTVLPSSQTAIVGQRVTVPNTVPLIKDKITTYTITLDPNKGSCSDTTLRTTKTESWTFYEWNTAASGAGNKYAPGRGVYHSCTLYLQAHLASSVTKDVVLPVPVRSGYEFLGWGTSTSQTSSLLTGKYTPTSSQTLYAIWKGGGAANLFDGTAYKKYQIYIYNGAEWKLHVPRIYNGENWDTVYA